jgi:hypothetical protein
LDMLYRTHRGIGGIIDDLLDPSPERRVQSFGGAADLFGEIQLIVTAQLELSARIVAEEDKPIFRAIDFVAGLLIVPELKDVINIARGEKHRREILAQFQGDTPNIILAPKTAVLGLAFVPLALNVLTISLVLGQIFSVRSVIHGDLNSFQALRENWIGWLVAISSSITAAKYYLGIFIGMDSRIFPSIVRFATRLCAVAPWGPILYLVLWNSHAWPICTALGVSLIACNNMLWYRATGRALQKMGTSGMRISPDMTTTNRNLFEWTWTIALYVAFVYIVALLLSRGLLNDIVFYGLAVSIGANGKMYFINSTHDAPTMRTGLDRIVRGYSRAVRV